nr:hypothetical protein Iba_chr05eCG9730 [Ipomoea batatas]
MSISKKLLNNLAISPDQPRMVNCKTIGQQIFEIIALDQLLEQAYSYYQNGKVPSADQPSETLPHHHNLERVADNPTKANMLFRGFNLPHCSCNNTFPELDLCCHTIAQIVNNFSNKCLHWCYINYLVFVMVERPVLISVQCNLLKYSEHSNICLPCSSRSTQQNILRGEQGSLIYFALDPVQLGHPSESWTLMEAHTSCLPSTAHLDEMQGYQGQPISINVLNIQDIPSSASSISSSSIPPPICIAPAPFSSNPSSSSSSSGTISRSLSSSSSSFSSNSTATTNIVIESIIITIGSSRHQMHHCHLDNQ